MKFLELIEIRELNPGEFGKRRFRLNKDMIKTMYECEKKWRPANTAIFLVGQEKPIHVLEDMDWIESRAETPMQVEVLKKRLPHNIYY